MNGFENIIAEKYGLDLDETLAFLASFSHVEVEKNVTLKKLASYIHLAPQSLSRIRSQIK